MLQTKIVRIKSREPLTYRHDGEKGTEMSRATINTFELPCYDSRKSFYGKAKVIETEDGRYLQSYDTVVCFLSYGGTFIKKWSGYSATTMRHINSFMKFIGWDECNGKKWWDSLEENKEYTR